MPQITAEQGTEEWFAARRGIITASIAPACLGVGPRKELSAYNEIMGLRSQSENGFMRWGKEHEKHARNAYEIVSGNLVVETGFWIAELPGMEWIGASPDGLIGLDGMVEIKCPVTLPTVIPQHHEIQMRVQMYVCDRVWADYFSWTQAGHFTERIHRDAKIECFLLMKLDQFKRDYLDNQIPPPRRRRKPTQATPSGDSNERTQPDAFRGGTERGERGEEEDSTPRLPANQDAGSLGENRDCGEGWSQEEKELFDDQ